MLTSDPYPVTEVTIYDNDILNPATLFAPFDAEGLGGGYSYFLYMVD